MKPILTFRQIKNIFWPHQGNHFRPYILNDKIIIAFILLFFLSKVLVGFQILLFQESKLFADLNAQKIIALTNEVRQQYGLPPLKENLLLNEAAEAKARDMFQNNYFSHFSPTGISPWYWITKAGYRYHYAGENLAMNFLDSEEVIRAWLNSPGHRANLLNKNYQDIGVAIIPADYSKTSGISQPLVVQMFGSPQTKTPALATATKNIKNKKESIILSPSTSSLAVTPKEKVLSLVSSTPSSLDNEQSVLAAEKQTSLEITPSSSILVATSQSPTKLEKVLSSQTLEKTLPTEGVTIDLKQINLFNRMVAFSLIVIGSFVILGILFSQRAIPFEFSEIILRGGLLIFLGLAFLNFHLEAFLGQLIIAS